MNAIIMKAELAAYWRFVRQMPLVAVEALSEDLLIVNKRGRLIVCEVKISISDLRHDIEKPKHEEFYCLTGLPLLPGQRERKADELTASNFYFGVPQELIEKAIKVRNELYPYAGLISVRESTRQFRGHQVTVVEDPKLIHDKQLNVRSLARFVKAQSASIANAYARLAK